jgi:large subunit ribosomal protein L31e
MAETENKKEIEREYIIPLMKQWDKVPRYKRANKAIRTIKEFLIRHMKIRDGDLKKVKIDKYLNEEVWFRGIKKPPHKIKVKVTREGENVRVELSDYKDKLKFKKAREERKNAQAEENVKSKKVVQKTEEHEHDHSHPEEKTEEEKKEEKEKKAAVVESTEKIEKESSKKMKHQTKQSKQPKHQFRKALQK